MAKFLLPPGSGAAEQIYDIVLGMKKDTQQVSIFSRRPELYRIVRTVASHYKSIMPDYYNRMRQVRKLKIIIHRTKDAGCSAEAFLDDNEIHLYKKYFRHDKDKQDRLVTIEHELTHIIQGLFEHKRGKKLAKKEVKYEHDWYEVETLSKDIYFEIINERKKRRLRTQTAVANYVRKHKDFIEFMKGDRKKTFKKIMTAVFSHRKRKLPV